MNISSISPSLVTPSLSASSAQAHASSATLLVNLAKQLNIQTPVPLEAKVLGAGTLNSTNIPATLLQTLTQSSNNASSTLLTAAPNTPLHWARLQLVNSPAVLILSHNLPQLLKAGQTLLVTLDVNGKLSYIPPSGATFNTTTSHSSAPSQTTSNLNTQTTFNLNTQTTFNLNTQTTTPPATTSNTTFDATTAKTTTLGALSISTGTEPTTNSVRTSKDLTIGADSNATNQAALQTQVRPATLNAITQLNQTLSQQMATHNSQHNNHQIPPSAPLSTTLLSTSLSTSLSTTPSISGLVAVTQLNNALKLLPPSLQQQLLPPKIEALLGKIPLQPTSATLAAELSEALRPTAIDAAMINLQSVVGLLKRVVGNDKTPPANNNVFLNLIANLPSIGATHEQIQQSRIAIAKWLAGEFTNAISQRSLNHSASLSQQAQTPDNLFIQQDTPLKWGDTLANLQITIEERREGAETKGQKNVKNRRKSHCWSVTMTLELPNNKTLGVDISLAAAEIDIDLWSSDSTLFTSINQNIAKLKTDLHCAGLTINSLECRQGRRPSQHQGLSQTLIDVIT